MDVNNHVDDGSGKYEAFTLAKLREELRKRGARVSGRKAELVSHFDSFLLLQLTDRASLCKQTTATPARTASYVAPLATEIVDNAAH